ncbi:SpoIID/LytB domain-containing protein [cyanobacterium endosymbiont of Epithemia turgida]|uniref:SpoIID/LytB domain-containing protein n=1 Tax=cyanobacterium endosymbiont of Epithemia turgida TaxID=718217 RepID=UPI0004D0BB2F|nr:SpoIID/LytB domain-containing protein [cyanobacterium endosymbiont of Epithemia turgida]BAP17390.1 sporulation protein [cyanobacterium endosymbiont of Epithemia turgida isolate EtSB Lake Yunoko]
MSQNHNLDSRVWTFKLSQILLGRYCWLIGIIWMILSFPVQGATELRVAIEKGVGSLKVGSSTLAIIRDGAGRKLGELTQLEAFAVKPLRSGVNLDQWNSNQIVIEPTKNGSIWISDRWYRGKVRLIRQGHGITAVNLVNLEEYLYSVVGSEAYPTWPMEALKSQAVVARTYALYKSSKGENRYYDLDTTTKTQVYKGLETEFVTTHEAVNETAGQVLTHNGKVILAAFHSSSGGHTENVEDVWSSPLPYLRGVLDYDQLAPVFQWRKSFSARQMGQLIGGVGAVKSLIPQRTTPHGRIITLKVVGTHGSKNITDDNLRKALDLKSTLFTVSANDETFQIDGRGYGHGIGLSQWGSHYLAEQGISYAQIVSHYYQNAQLTTLN